MPAFGENAQRLPPDRIPLDQTLINKVMASSGGDSDHDPCQYWHTIQQMVGSATHASSGGDAFESSLVASTSHAIVPIDVDIVLTSATIDDVPELQDRMLVATANSLGVPLLTSDRVIAGSKYAQFIR